MSKGRVKVAQSSNFYKNKKTDIIWWVDNPDDIGIFEFSFDRAKIYNLFRDYPDAMTPEEVKIFDRENPFWAEFFADRRK